MTPKEFCLWLDGYIQSHNNIDVDHDEYDYDFKIDIIQKFKEVDFENSRECSCKIKSRRDHQEYWKDVIDDLEQWVK